MNAHTARQLIRDNGAFVALAAIVMSLFVVPMLEGSSKFVVLVVSGVLALACVEVLVDRLQSPENNRANHSS
jgi:hypothetical protein